MNKMEKTMNPNRLQVQERKPKELLKTKAWYKTLITVEGKKKQLRRKRELLKRLDNFEVLKFNLNQEKNHQDIL